MSIQNFKCKIAEIGMTANKKTPISYDGVMAQLRKMDLDEATLDRLSKKARSMPHGSLDHFMTNIQAYIAMKK
jgi:hypothetical protein